MCIYRVFLCVIWVLLSGEDSNIKKESEKKFVCVIEDEEEVLTEKFFFGISVCVCTIVCVRACVSEVSLETLK